MKTQITAESGWADATAAMTDDIINFNPHFHVTLDIVLSAHNRKDSDGNAIAGHISMAGHVNGGCLIKQCATALDSGATLHVWKQKEDFEPNLHSRCKDAFALPGDQTETPVIGQATSWMKINGDVIALSMSLHAPKFDSDLSSTTRHRRSGMGNSFLSSDKKIIPVVPKFLH